MVTCEDAQSAFECGQWFSSATLYSTNLIFETDGNAILTLKAPSKIVVDDTFILLLLSFGENNA